MKQILFIFVWTVLLVQALSVEVQETGDIMAPCEGKDLDNPEDKVMLYTKGDAALDLCILILNETYCYHTKPLIDQCNQLIDANATGLLKHELFTTLSETTLSGLLERDTFYAPEIEIFKSVKSWIANNPNANVSVSWKTRYF